MWSSGDLSLVMFTFAPVLLLSELLKFAIKLTNSSYLMQPASSLLLFHTYFSRTFRDSVRALSNFLRCWLHHTVIYPHLSITANTGNEFQSVTPVFS